MAEASHPTAQAHQDPPPITQRIRSFVGSFWIGKSLEITVELGIPQLLGDAGHKSAEEIATATKTNQDAIYRVMRALVANGYYKEVSHRVFANNELTAPLCDPLTQAPLVHLFREFAIAWSHAMHSVRTGEPSFDHTHNKEDFFNMTAFSGPETEQIVAHYNFGQYKHICDVGGSHGVLLSKILSNFPSVERGTNFDLPDVVKGAKKVPRMESVGGSFFESVPAGADAYTLKWILHDWSDEKCIEILKTVRKAIPQHGKVLIIEAVLPEESKADESAAFLTLLDLHMMLVTPKGKERTEKQWEEVLHKSGFKLHYKTQYMPHKFVIEGVPV